MDIFERIKFEKTKGPFYLKLSNHTWQLKQLIKKCSTDQTTGWIDIIDKISNWAAALAWARNEGFIVETESSDKSFSVCISWTILL